MKVIFPNQKSLQPIPSKDAHPNISGNINSTTDVSPDITQNQDTSITENNISNIISENTDSKTPLFYILSVLSIFLVLLLVFFIYKKLTKNSLEN